MNKNFWIGVLVGWGVPIILTYVLKAADDALKGMK